MAQFYGTIKGSSSTEATRTGGKTSGLTSIAASWNGCVRVHVFEDKDGNDAYRIYEDTWHGKGRKKLLAEGKFPSN